MGYIPRRPREIHRFVVDSTALEQAMKLNAKIVGGAFVTLAAVYYWLVARPSNLETTPSIILVFYLFTFRMFPFADVLWTIAGAALLYRGIDEARAA